MKKYYQYKTLKQFANAFVRRESTGNSATKLIPGEKLEIVHHLDFGYRKKTTGEYVPNKYLNNFGWKNTYYQHAVNEVEIPYEIYLWFGWRI